MAMFIRNESGGKLIDLVELMNRVAWHHGDKPIQVVTDDGVVTFNVTGIKCNVSGVEIIVENSE